jgi:RHS repeat-associated protein
MKRRGGVCERSLDKDSDFGFSGHYVHSSGGLALSLYRVYHPEIGRWPSEDPIRFRRFSFAQSYGVSRDYQVMNDLPPGPKRLGALGREGFYAYARNNPLSFIDPLGLQSEEKECDPCTACFVQHERDEKRCIRLYEECYYECRGGHRDGPNTRKGGSVEECMQRCTEPASECLREEHPRFEECVEKNCLTPSVS